MKTNVELSRRVAKIMGTEAIMYMAPMEKKEFADTVASAKDFQDLPEKYQALILKCEGHDNPKYKIVLGSKGSAKSGNRGHAGRPGKVGGSMPKSIGPVEAFTSEAIDNNKHLSKEINRLAGKAATSKVAYYGLLDKVAAELASKTGVDAHKIQRLAAGWAFRYLDHDNQVGKLKTAAAKQFGLTSRVSSDIDEDHAKLSKQIYADTQAQLQALGFKPTDRIRLYRGMGDAALQKDLELGASGSYGPEALNSWTYSKSVGKNIVGAQSTSYGRIVEADVPVRDIFSLGTTGIGYTGDKEVVVLGRNLQTRVVSRYNLRNDSWESS